jgi:hypothetical protein
MKLYFTERFPQNYGSAPPHIYKAFDKQASYLVEDLRHPSLQAKSTT